MEKLKAILTADFICREYHNSESSYVNYRYRRNLK